MNRHVSRGTAVIVPFPTFLEAREQDSARGPPMGRGWGKARFSWKDFRRQRDNEDSYKTNLNIHSAAS